MHGEHDVRYHGRSCPAARCWCAAACTGCSPRRPGPRLVTLVEMTDPDTGRIVASEQYFVNFLRGVMTDEAHRAGAVPAPAA